jgi:hypothetical protein
MIASAVGDLLLTSSGGAPNVGIIEALNRFNTAPDHYRPDSTPPLIHAPPLIQHRPRFTIDPREVEPCPTCRP